MSDPDAKVVRLLDRAPGISPDDHADLCEWLAHWADALKSGDYGRMKSFVVVIEGDNGLAMISQSLEPLDLARITGLVSIAAHRRADGGAFIQDLKP